MQLAKNIVEQVVERRTSVVKPVVDNLYTHEIDVRVVLM